MRLTCIVPIKKYYDVERQKFVRDSMASIRGYSLAHASCIQRERPFYIPDYGQGYVHRYHKWFTPKDCDWED